MPSPFPGVDPYIENLGILRDFHRTFLVLLRGALKHRLPPTYATLLDAEFHIVESTQFEPVEDRLDWIEVQRLPERELIAVIELLSPTNKGGHSRSEYIAKRNVLLDREIHLIELDLLLSGARLPIGAELPRGDFYAFVSRADRGPQCAVYPWSIRQPLPTIAIPLRAPDPDIPLDLAAAYASTCDAAGYDRLLRYNAPLTVPLADADRAWAADLARQAAR